MATPSSRPSIESSPSPSPNSGSSLSISSGAMSSRFRALTISLLSSCSSSTLAMLQSSDVIGFEMRDQLARAARAAGGGEEGRGLEPLAGLDAECRPPRRNRVPGRALDQGNGIAGDGHELQIGASKSGDMREAALEAERAPGDGARSLRKDDQVVAAIERRAAAVDERLRLLVVPEIAGRSDDRPQQGMTPELVFHDALRVGQERHDQHHVEQGRMIGDDEIATA